MGYARRTKTNGSYFLGLVSCFPVVDGLRIFMVSMSGRTASPDVDGTSRFAVVVLQNTRGLMSYRCHVSRQFDLCTFFPQSKILGKTLM